MKNILQQIVTRKHQEVAASKQRLPLARLKKHPGLQRQPLSLSELLLRGPGVIAEFKRASPSKGMIREGAVVTEVVNGYHEAGAVAVSVLTDRHFFQAQEGDLETARRVLPIPILRKEFIIDPYQVYEAKVMGADAVLLIAAILSSGHLNDYRQLATDLGLEALVEVHNIRELDKLSGHEELIGVNNRNLDTFAVDITTSLSLAGQLGTAIKVTESGLGPGANLQALQEAGYQGFLVGESFMRAADPGLACTEFISHLTPFSS